MVEDLTREVKVGDIYTGKVVRLMNFGAFVEILPGKDGLVHISELSEHHVARVEDEVDIGDEMTVVVREIDSMGRINLSRKALLLGEEFDPDAEPALARGGGGRDRDRGGYRPQGRRSNGDRGGYRGRPGGDRQGGRGGRGGPRGGGRGGPRRG